MPASTSTLFLLREIAAGRLSGAEADALARLLADYADFCDRRPDQREDQPAQTPGDSETRESPDKEKKLRD